MGHTPILNDLAVAFDGQYFAQIRRYSASLERRSAHSSVHVGSPTVPRCAAYRGAHGPDRGVSRFKGLNVFAILRIVRDPYYNRSCRTGPEDRFGVFSRNGLDCTDLRLAGQALATRSASSRD